MLAGWAPALEDLPRLVYAEQVVKESMRFFPPAYALGREAIADCEIGCGVPVRLEARQRAASAA